MPQECAQLCPNITMRMLISLTLLLSSLSSVRGQILGLGGSDPVKLEPTLPPDPCGCDVPSATGIPVPHNTSFSCVVSNFLKIHHHCPSMEVSLIVGTFLKSLTCPCGSLLWRSFNQRLDCWNVSNVESMLACC